MKKLLVAAALTLAGAAQAAWEPVWVDDTSRVFLETNAIYPIRPGGPRTKLYLRGTIHSNYYVSQTDNRNCYPSEADCQWKRASATVTFDWDCRNRVRLVQENSEWVRARGVEPPEQQWPDYGLRSHDDDARWQDDRWSGPRPDIHPAHPAVQPPAPLPPGGIYNITGRQSLLAAQARVCEQWPAPRQRRGR